MCVWELNINNIHVHVVYFEQKAKRYSEPSLSQYQVMPIKHGINSFVYQGSKQWNALSADAKDIECFNVL